VLTQELTKTMSEEFVYLVHPYTNLSRVKDGRNRGGHESIMYIR